MNKFRVTPIGFEWQDGTNYIDRHFHSVGYVTIVLSGSYSEAGDSGRRRLEPGDVVVHDAYEAHANLIGPRGARLFSLPLPLMERPCIPNGRISNLDTVIRAVECDVISVLPILKETIEPRVTYENDWPDELARAITTDWALGIAQWAKSYGLAPETVSRRFRAAYGVSPKRFRATARARAAWSALVTGTPAADIVHDLKFTDQSHFCREIFQLTGATPSAWQVKSIQYAEQSQR